MTTPALNPDGTSANGGKLSTSGAVVAILGAAALAYPKAVPIIGAIQAAIPAVQTLLPLAMTAGGAVAAAFGHPAAWLRRLFGK